LSFREQVLAHGSNNHARRTKCRKHLVFKGKTKNIMDIRVHGAFVSPPRPAERCRSGKGWSEKKDTKVLTLKSTVIRFRQAAHTAEASEQDNEDNTEKNRRPPELHFKVDAGLASLRKTPLRFPFPFDCRIQRDAGGRTSFPVREDRGLPVALVVAGFASGRFTQ
jgi:hypothetical protein